MRHLEYPGRSPVAAPNGMASTSHPLSTQAAVRILLDGGNALDAAIAACAVQCVVEPESTGIGGDCFCLYAPAGSAESIVAFNGRAGAGRAQLGVPACRGHNQDRTPFRACRDGAWRRRRVGSAEPRSWEHALDRLLLPAIGYARDGYPITQRVARDFASQVNSLDSDARGVFTRDGGPIPLGARHAQPALAATLRGSAEKGEADSMKARSPRRSSPSFAASAAGTPGRTSPSPSATMSIRSAPNSVTTGSGNARPTARV